MNRLAPSSMNRAAALVALVAGHRRLHERSWQRHHGHHGSVAARGRLGDARAAPAQPSPSWPIELSVFAAASLKDALAAVKAAYESAVPGVTLIVATDASSTLRTQIEQGAPADVFLSADTKNPDALVDGGLADGQTVVFARNRLTVIVPLDNPAAIATATDLARPGIKVVAAGDEVPITKYATQVVEGLAHSRMIRPGSPGPMPRTSSRRRRT